MLNYACQIIMRLVAHTISEKLFLFNLRQSTVITNRRNPPGQCHSKFDFCLHLRSDLKGVYREFYQAPWGPYWRATFHCLINSAMVLPALYPRDLRFAKLPKEMHFILVKLRYKKVLFDEKSTNLLKLMAMFLLSYGNLLANTEQDRCANT